MNEMNKGRKTNKLNLVRQHRQTWYERELDKLINGQAKPEDVSSRFNKLKQVDK